MQILVIVVVILLTIFCSVIIATVLQFDDEINKAERELFNENQRKMCLKRCIDGDYSGAWGKTVMNIKTMMGFCCCTNCNNRATKTLTIYNRLTRKTRKIRVCEDCAWEIEGELWKKSLEKESLQLR